MSQNLEARMRGLQPPLPLVEPTDATDEPVSGDSGGEWRLDDHTREVGRRGIADARARLRSSSGATSATTGRPPAADRPRDVPGRAA